MQQYATRRWIDNLRAPVITKPQAYNCWVLRTEKKSRVIYSAVITARKYIVSPANVRKANPVTQMPYRAS